MPLGRSSIKIRQSLLLLLLLCCCAFVKHIHNRSLFIYISWPQIFGACVAKHDPLPPLSLSLSHDLSALLPISLLHALFVLFSFCFRFFSFVLPINKCIVSTHWVYSVYTHPRTRLFKSCDWLRLMCALGGAAPLSSSLGLMSLTFLRSCLPLSVAFSASDACVSMILHVQREPRVTVEEELKFNEIQ